MPSSEPLPTIRELERAFHAAVASERKTEDNHDGSIYDRWSGVGALCMRRLAERDQGEARAIFFDTASDGDLDHYIELRFGAERVSGTSGVGSAQLERSGGTSGTIPQGTRILVRRTAGDESHYWQVSQDILVNGEMRITVPVVAEATGLDGQIAVNAGDVSVLRIDDPLWEDATWPWAVNRLDCGPGTSRQRDPEVRAAIRQDRYDRRPGFEVAITRAMRAAGASAVALYQSDYLGPSLDYGLNRIYVGDDSYNSSPALLTACRLAVAGTCVAGTSVQVLPMADALVFARANVELWADPGRFNQGQYAADASAALLEYFLRRDNAFVWSEDAMRTQIMKAVPNVHRVTVAVTDSSGTAVPEPDPLSMFASVPLLRYRAANWTVSATVSGPT